MHSVMNVSFIITGVLTIAGAIALQRMWPHSRLTSVTLVLWVITGLGKVTVGLVPENPNINLHLLAAFNIQVGCRYLAAQPVDPPHHAVSVTGIVLAVIGLAGTVLSTSAEFAGSSLYLGLGAGGMERVADYPGSLWLLMMGIIAVLSTGPHVGDRAARSQASWRSSPSSASSPWQPCGRNGWRVTAGRCWHLRGGVARLGRVSR